MNIPIFNLVLLTLLYFPLRLLLRWISNLRAAHRSRIPYVIVPVIPYQVFWQTINPLLLPLLHKLPPALTHPWIRLIDSNFAWIDAYGIFQRPRAQGGAGADTFLMVTPQTNYLLTADREVISQITTRRNDFPKPVELYAGIAIYGGNVVTADERGWRRHRRITAPPFGEKNNRVVWVESLFQAGEMVRYWREGKGEEGKPAATAAVVEGKSEGKGLGVLVGELSHDAMRLSLNVISRAGFDVRCGWPGGESEGDTEGSMSATEVPKGHSMSYVDSLETLLLRLIALFVFPIWVLEYAPFSYLRKARVSFLEWGKYMNEIYDRKFNEILQSKGPEDEGMDLMGAMIRGSGQIPGTANHGKLDAGMTQEEIIGNSFVLFLAGHETAANSIHFSLLYLAMRPDAQRKLQADLDTIFGDRDPSKWDYDTDLPKLFAGWAGAVMNEQLRLIPPVNNIPKSTAPGSPQPLLIDGKEYIVPENCSIGLHTVGVHRNPKYWPHGPVRKLGPINPNSNTDNDLEEFKPERWLATDKAGSASATDTAGPPPLSVPSTDGLAVDTTPDTTSAFKPGKGAYIPFSDGPRACLGRRFAQVEILATLAVVFSRYSVELAVDEWASAEEVRGMDGDERARVWGKAREEVERKMRDEMGTIITLQLRKEGVRVRLVERGGEMFSGRG